MVWATCSKQSRRRYTTFAPVNAFRIFTASTNQQNEVAFQMVDAVSRLVIGHSAGRRLPQRQTLNCRRLAREVSELQDGSVATSPLEMTAGQLLVQALMKALAEAHSDFEADDQTHVLSHSGTGISHVGQFDEARDYALSSLANGPETAAKYASRSGLLKTESWTWQGIIRQSRRVGTKQRSYSI